MTVPLSTMLSSQENFEVVTTELFGPFQVLVPYKDDEIDDVSRALPILDSVQTD
eukprot:SAG25_NODE_650_length_6188_cov_4.455740_6_plen_54_part_00